MQGRLKEFGGPKQSGHMGPPPARTQSLQEPVGGLLAAPDCEGGRRRGEGARQDTSGAWIQTDGSGDLTEAGTDSCAVRPGVYLGFVLPRPGKTRAPLPF